MVATGSGAPSGATSATSPTTGGTGTGGTSGGTTGGTGTGTAAGTTPTEEQQSARALINIWLAQFGLSALTDWAWDKILDGEGFDQITLEVPTTETFKKRFPAYEQMLTLVPNFTVKDYVDYENNVFYQSSRYGIPQEMYGTPEKISDMLIKGVSANEVNDRFQIAAAASQAAPKEVKDAITALYGVGEGAFVAYYLDPDIAMPILERQWAAAQVAGAASQQQMTSNREEAERLASMGITYDAARKGFGQAESQEGLGGAGITREDRVAAAFGDQAAAMRIQTAQQRRASDFAGGGGAAESQQGVGGLLGAGTT